MPTYRFRCETHGDWEAWRSIKDDALPTCDDCGVTAVLVMVPPRISVDALPNKSPDAKRTLERDRQWEKDMPAYKALRKNGLQPRGIDGCSKIQATAEDRLEVEMGKKIDPKDINKAKDAHSEIKENARKGVARQVGETLREAKKPKKIAVAT